MIAEIFHQFMVYRAALHRNLEPDEILKTKFTVSGEIKAWTFGEVVAFKIHAVDFRKKNIFGKGRKSHN